MKHYFSLALFFFSAIYNITAQTVTIPDPNFEQALIDLGIDSDETINQSVLYSDIQYIQNLDISGKEISDLTGISSFSELRNLNCSNNLLTSLTIPPELGTLDCSSNMLTSLPNIPKELYSLDCSSNLFSSLSFGGTFLITLKINQNPNLTSLVISGNNYIPNITYINDGGLRSVTISQNPNLSSITCHSNNQLGGLIITENESLTNLELFNLQSLDYLDLSQNNSLTSLNLDYFESLSDLVLRHANIHSLHLEYLSLSNLDVSQSAINYIQLENVWGTLSLIVGENTNLRGLQCWDTGLTGLDLSDIPSLDYLEIDNDNNIRNINLSQSSIKNLYLKNTPKLESLILRPDASLQTFECENAALTNLDFSQNLNLNSLRIIDVPLTTLNLSVNLYDIRVSNSDLTSLDLSQILNLNNLVLMKNALTSLDLSQNPNLKILNVSENTLANLDFSHNPKLSNITVEDIEELSYVDLSKNLELEELSIKNNDKLKTIDLRNGNNSLLTRPDMTDNPLLTCIMVDDGSAANAGETPYENWEKDDNATYRTESCLYDIVISTNVTELLENGEQVIITATLNEANPDEDVTVNLEVSGSALASNYILSSNSIVIPSGQLTGTAILTAVEDDMDSDKTVIIDVESVENADELTEQQLTFTIIHINNAPTDIGLSSLIVDENSNVGTEIGELTTTDIDSEDSFTYTLVAGEGDDDNSRFTITDDKLLTNKVFDFETENSYSIRIQTDDGNGEVFSKSFAISIVDLNFLVVEDSKASLRYKNDIVVKLESSDVAKGFQFDITFPDSFVFAPSDLTNVGLPENFQISSSNVGGNTYRVIGFSLTNETIAPGAFPIITLPTFINEGTPTGEYSIPVFNVNLSDVNNMDIATRSPIDGVVTVYRYPRGDANGDNQVNILDILSTVDYIFGNPPSFFNFELVDINSDDTINVLDVLGIQDIILNPIARMPNKGYAAMTSKKLTGENYLNIISSEFSSNTTQTIEINLVNENVIKGLQFDVVLPEGFNLNPADIVGTSRLEGFNVNAQEISDNNYKVLIFSLTSSTVASGTGAILELPVVIENDIALGVYPIEPVNVILSGTNNTDISTQAPSIGEITITSSALDIEGESVFENNIIFYPNPVNEVLIIDSKIKGNYQLIDLNGRSVGGGRILLGRNKVNTSLLLSGVYVIFMSDGKRKVINKIIKN